MKTVQIDLSRWNIVGLLKHDGTFSSLLTSTGRQCCLGFACSALGVPDCDIRYKNMPWDILNNPFDEERALQSALANANDNNVEFQTFPLEDRIGFIITGFLEMGLEIEFVNPPENTACTQP